MAEAEEQSMYMPLLWPAGNVIRIVTAPEDEKPRKNEAFAILDLTGNIMAMFASIRNFGLALLMVFSLPKLHAMDYPAFGLARVYSWNWVWPIFMRNIVATWIICGLWDWFLYFSPFKAKLHKYKVNQKYPSMNQFKHDAFYTTLTSCWAAVVEIVLCHWWANGAVPMENDLREAPVRNTLIALFITHIRIPHFHLIHRMMHPWKTTRIPDIGKFLYRHVHSLHHKSYNPTAFSGTNMHPVEGTLYYTAALIPVYFGLHPVFAVAIIVDCAIGAWLGHDGFQWPGQGDYFHLLHHKHFDGNYGAVHVPLDWLFGTFISCEDDLKKVWKEKPSGEEANETPVHKDREEENETKKVE